MSGVFISYRRADSQGWAGRLGADLAEAFGDVARFFDIASIGPGADFAADIARAIDAADAVLVLIGPRWLESRDAQGRRRLDGAEDLVATEVALALLRPVPVIPLLLGGAAMPAAADLPERLRALAARNAAELSDRRWPHDRDALFAALEAATPLRRRALAPTGATVSVGADLKLRDSEVGRVTGVRGPAPAGAAVEVLRGARMRNARIGDITGVDLGGPPKGKAP